MLNTRWFFRCMGHHPHFNILLVTQLSGLFLKWLDSYALIWKWHFNHYFQHLMASKWSLSAAGVASRMLYHTHPMMEWESRWYKTQSRNSTHTILTQPPSLQWIKYVISQSMWSDNCSQLCSRRNAETWKQGPSLVTWADISNAWCEGRGIPVKQAGK